MSRTWMTLAAIIFGSTAVVTAALGAPPEFRDWRPIIGPVQPQPPCFVNSIGYLTDDLHLLDPIDPNVLGDAIREIVQPDAYRTEPLVLQPSVTGR